MKHEHSRDFLHALCTTPCCPYRGSSTPCDHVRILSVFVGHGTPASSLGIHVPNVWAVVKFYIWTCDVSEASKGSTARISSFSTQGNWRVDALKECGIAEAEHPAKTPTEPIAATAGGSRPRKRPGAQNQRSYSAFLAQQNMTFYTRGLHEHFSCTLSFNIELCSE